MQMECRFVVWEQMWLTDEPMKLTEDHCSTDRHLRCSDVVPIKTENSILEEEIDVSKWVSEKIVCVEV